MYLIRSLQPSNNSMGAHGFSIELSPEWRTMVAASGLDQEMIENKIQTCGREWLDCCGYNQLFDPDNPRYSIDRLEGRNPKPGPNARPLYCERNIRVKWGEWGLEMIDVPGNASGLYIDHRPVGAFMRGAAMLQPHNVDCWAQKQLILIVFTSFAEDIVLFGRPYE